MGRQQWESVVATAARERLVLFEQTLTGTIAAGGFENFKVYANPGTVVRVIGAYAETLAVPGGVSGTHGFYFSYEPSINLIVGTTAFNKDVKFSGSSFEKSDFQVPADLSAQVAILNQIQFDSIRPFNLAYANSTDKPQSNQRSYKVLGIERQVG